MFSTQIFIPVVVLISSVHFITCPAVTDGGATKPVMSKFAVVNDKPDTTADILVEGEMNKSNLGQTSVQTKFRDMISKSVGFLFSPVKKSWKIIKSFMPLRQNTSVVTRNNNTVNGEVIN